MSNLKIFYKIGENNLITYSKYIIIFFVLVSFLGCSSGDKKHTKINVVESKIVPTKIVTLSTENPDLFFKKEYEIELSNKAIIGTIGYLDVFRKNKILITDPISKKIFLFDSKGAYLKELDTKNCTPGFKLQPIYSRFNKQGKIYAINEFGTGYVFNEIGECEGPLDNFFDVPHIGFLNSGEIIAYSNKGDGNYLKIYDAKGTEIEKFGVFPSKFKHTIERIMGGGLVVDGKDYIYQINVMSAEIFVYRDRKFVKKLSNHMKNYHVIDSDILNPHNPKEILDQYKKMSQEKTMITQLFLANENVLLIQSYRNKKYSAQLLSTNGEKYLQNTIKLDVPFIYAKDGYGYKFIQPEPIDGRLPNPKIIIYKINF